MHLLPLKLKVYKASNGKGKVNAKRWGEQEQARAHKLELVWEGLKAINLVASDLEGMGVPQNLGPFIMELKTCTWLRSQDGYRKI